MNVKPNPTTICESVESHNASLSSRDVLAKQLENFLFNQQVFADNCPPIIKLQLRNLNRNCSLNDFIHSLTANKVNLLLEIFDNFATLK